jgi:tRNA threonylcarbamoyladenosine biosynthesis protein TsaB
MLTLALDTTADYGSIALADEKGCREEVLLHAPQGFSHILFGAIEALLTRSGVQLKEIELFAGASGPGSFTGVRVGLSAVKGLAEVMGCRAVAVSNLDALYEFGQSNLRATVIDARRGEIYGAVYGVDGATVVPEVVAPFQRFLSLVPPQPVEWISPDPEVFASSLLPDTAIIKAPRATAGVIAQVAIRRGNREDPVAIEANYVRRSDAELLFSK